MTDRVRSQPDSILYGLSPGIQPLRQQRVLVRHREKERVESVRGLITTHVDSLTARLRAGFLFNTTSVHGVLKSGCGLYVDWVLSL